MCYEERAGAPACSDRLAYADRILPGLSAAVEEGVASARPSLPQTTIIRAFLDKSDAAAVMNLPPSPPIVGWHNQGVRMPLFCAHGVRQTVVPKNLHHLEATPDTIHWGYFDPARAPALKIKSGDLIQAE